MNARSALGALGVAVAILLASAAPAASQDFGFNTTAAAPNYPFTCAHGIPTLRGGVAVGAPPFQTGTSGFPSCTWTSAGFNAGLFPPGPGTVTAVQLPALQNPGPMQVVVLQTERINGANPGVPTLVCCQIVAASQVFTPQANTPSNIPVNLPVNAGPATAIPGQSQSGQLLALQILSPTAQLPVLDLGQDDAPIHSSIWLPAFNGSTQEFIQPGNAAGYVLLMSASFTPGVPGGAGGGTGGGGAGGGGGTGGGPGGGGGGTGTGGGGGTGMGNPTATVTPQSLGLSLTGRPNANSRGVASLGNVSNPPTSSTTQFIRLPGSSANLATGKTRVAAGKKRRMTVKLTSRGKRLLRRRKSVKAELTVVATDAFGLQMPYTRSITLKR